MGHNWQTGETITAALLNGVAQIGDIGVAGTPTGDAIATAIAAGGGGSGAASKLTPTATKTAAYTAAVGDLAVMNVAGGATTLTLPTAPANKAQVGFLAVGATAATPLTVNRGGTTDTLGPSGATSVTAVLANEVTVYQYDAPNTRWLAVSNVKPQAALNATYARTTDAYGTAAGQPDGTPTTITSGQAATSFGNAPISVASGVYVHTPAQQSNSAGYLQAALRGNIDRIGCKFTAAANATGSVALVAPSAPWATGNVTPTAGIHFVLTAAGAWNIAYWTGTTQQNYASGQLSTAINDGVTRRVDITINRDASTAYISLPDGSVISVTDARIAANTNALAIWELYEFNGVGAVPMTLNSVWADSATYRGEAPAAASPLDVAKAVAAAQSAVVALTYAPTTTGDVVAPTTLTDINATSLVLPPIVAPASGRILVELTGYVAMSATGQYLWAIANGATALATQTMVNQQYTGMLTMRVVLTGLVVGQAYTLKWQHFCTVATTATFKLNKGNGYQATMSATPLAA